MMEENNNNQEPVMEQRPSTKYGRTAYQQQMQEAQNEQGMPQQETEAAEETQQNAYQENMGWQQSLYQENMNRQQNEYRQNGYQEHAYGAYTSYEEPRKEVKHIFAKVSMWLVLVSVIISTILVIMSSKGYAFAGNMEELYAVIQQVVMTPGYMVLTYVSNALFWLTVVFLVLDIVQLYKAGYKIVGAILFAVFLRPAYFIWRAHLLKQKKTVPIVFAVCCYLITFFGMFLMFGEAMEMTMRILG